MITCENCGRDFKSSLALSTHQRTPCVRPHILPDGRFQCDDCGRAFSAWKKMNNHQKYLCRGEPVDPRVLRGDELSCAVCGAVVSPSSDHDCVAVQRRRMRDPLACPWDGCDYVAGDVRARNQHVINECMHRVEPESTDWRCECGYVATTKSGFGLHRHHCAQAALAPST